MSRDVPSLRKVLRAQRLKTRAAEARLGIWKSRLADLEAEEQACFEMLQNQALAVDAVTRSLTKRVAGLAARKDNVNRQIEQAQAQVQVEKLRAEKVEEWLMDATQALEEDLLAEASEDAVANKIHTSA